MIRQFKNAYDTIIMDHIDLNMEGKKVLIVNLVFLAIMLAEKNEVTFVTDVVEAKELFEHSVIGNGEFGCDDKCIFIEGINKARNACSKEGQANWLNWFKENEMKFDVAIMNPPYDRNLHLKILEAVIPYAEKVVNISPVRWLQDPFAPYSTRSDYCKFENTISKKIESLNIISTNDASKLFDAEFYSDLGIYVCGMGGYEYQHNDPLVTKIIEKTMENSWKNYINLNLPYKLNIGLFGGDGHGFGLYYITRKTYEGQLECTSDGFKFSFGSETERKNFYDSLNHPFMKWHMSLWKADMHLYANKIPYFDDYAHPWDYADFFAWFNLSEEEQERVMQEIAQMQAE